MTTTPTAKRTAQQTKNLKAWIRALRSGEYKQTKGALAKQRPDGTDGFCCLGVVADVCLSNRNEWVLYDGPNPERSGVWDLILADGSKRGSMLNQSDLNRLVGPGLDVVTLANMNDGVGIRNRSPKRFTTIANYIEAQTGVKA